MSVPNQKRNRRVNRNTNNRQFVGGRRMPLMLKTALDGKSIVPSADPSTIVDLPWNTITLTFENVLTSPQITLTSADIDTNLRESYPSSGLYQYRIRSARLWETTGTASISATFFSLDVSNPGFLLNQDDSPGRNHWARVGYIWPRSHQNQTLAASEEQNIVQTRASIATGATILLHIDILWKPIVTVVPVSQHMTKKFKFPETSASSTSDLLPQRDLQPSDEPTSEVANSEQSNP